MAGQTGGVGVSKTSTHLAKIEEDILGLPGPEFEALAEWFSMVLTLRRAVSGSGHKYDPPSGPGVESGAAAEVPAAGPELEEEAEAGEAEAAEEDVYAAEAGRWGAPREPQRRRRTKIQNRRWENSEIVGSATGSGTPEPSYGSHCSQDGEAGAEAREEPSSGPQETPAVAPTAEGRALLALCGGGRNYRDVAEGRRALQALCGEWRDTTGSSYEVSMCPSGDRLNVSTRRPGAGRAMCTKGLIRLQKKADAEGVRIAWGAKASFVLVSPNDQPDVVQWASPDNYRKPFEWWRSQRRGSGGGREDWPRD